MGWWDRGNYNPIRALTWTLYMCYKKITLTVLALSKEKFTTYWNNRRKFLSLGIWRKSLSLGGFGVYDSSKFYVILNLPF